jgi:myo-inositol 2-dehydrogenase / D-chiro-inositol 1-dehydrogenase
MAENKMSRRTLVKSVTAAATMFNIVPRHVLGGQGYIPPSEQLTRAIIGSGGMAQSHMRYDGSRVLAICDVDKRQLTKGIATCKKKGFTVDTYHDYREMIARDDIDIVSVVTPPHWHALHAIAASNAGKDVWCEKPMTRTIGEGQKVIEACKRNGTIFRINTWFRLGSNFYGSGVTAHEIKKVVRSGILGGPLKITIGKHQGFNWKIDMWSGKTNLEPQPIPAELDYDFWLGPAPAKPYHSHRVHQSFRGYWDYDGGGLGDMGMHYLDPVQYYLDKDHTSPVKVEVDTDPQHHDAVKVWRKVTYTYEDGTQIILDGDNSMTNAPYIEGPKGKIYKGFRSTIPRLRERLASMPSVEHQNSDFHECVRTRKKFALNEENGHRSTTMLNMAITALQLNRTLHFDPVKQVYLNDDEANRFINQPMRGQWNLDGGVQ